MVRKLKKKKHRIEVGLSKESALEFIKREQPLNHSNGMIEVVCVWWGNTKVNYQKQWGVFLLTESD